MPGPIANLHAAPPVLIRIAPTPTRLPEPSAPPCLDEAILSDRCRTGALFACPPDRIPFWRFLEELNRANRIGREHAAREPADTRRAPESGGPCEPDARVQATGIQVPRLGDVPPAPAEAPRPSPPPPPPPRVVRSAAGRLLDVLA